MTHTNNDMKASHKSEIFTNAWILFRENDHYNFSHALKMSWFEFNNRSEEDVQSLTFNSLKSSLEMLSETNGNSAERILPIWSEIMRLSDEQDHFAGEIVEKLIMNHKSISNKQQWTIVYFAKNNGLLTA